MSKRLTTELFILAACKVHGDRYDYSLVEYVNNYTKVRILCREHGEFLQSPNHHLRGKGCKACVVKPMKYTTESFILKAISIHGDKFTYEKVEYITNSTPIIPTCRIHGDFTQLPSQHLRYGCNKCAQMLASYRNRFDIRNDNNLYILYFPEFDVWKVGVTKHTIAYRFKQDNIAIDTILFLPIVYAYRVEYRIKIIFSDIACKDLQILHAGNSELFYGSPPKSIIKIIKEEEQKVMVEIDKETH